MSGKGADGKRDIQRTVDTLKEFDLVGLQEVRDILLDGKPDQAAQLGKSLSMQWLFAPSVSRWGTPVHGNGLLSKFKAVQWQRTSLPSRSGSATRNLLHVQLDIQGQPVHVLVTHLTMAGDRKAQLEQIFSVFLKLPAPVILMGDLNTRADDPMIKRVRDRPDVIDVRTYMTKADQNRISVDWILLRGIDVLKAGVAKSAASDHHLVWTEIRIAPVHKPNQALPETKPEK